MLYRRRVGGVNFDGIRASASQRPDLVVGPVCNQSCCFGIFAEEVLAHIGTVLRLEVLVLAIDAFLHALAQFARGILRQQRVPTGTPQHLDDVPARATENTFQLLHYFAVAAHRSVEALEVAVDDEHQVVELLAAAE